VCWRILPPLVAAGAAAVVAGGCATSASHDGNHDPPRLVPWSKIGDISLGEPQVRVEREYGTRGHGYHVIAAQGSFTQGYYVLHGGQVGVTFEGGRVEQIEFGVPYYRTKSGFGIGSRIPLGPCHRTAAYRCERRWRGFVWNEYRREALCGCWTKVGLGRQSLPISVRNFLGHWFFIYIRHGRVAYFVFASRFVD
jgi:hypothetical protein